MRSLLTSTSLLCTFLAVYYRSNLIDFAVYIEDKYFPLDEVSTPNLESISNGLQKVRDWFVMPEISAPSYCNFSSTPERVLLGSGWSKTVYEERVWPSERTQAVKVPNTNGENYRTCKRRHFGKQNAIQLCRIEMANAFIQELKILELLKFDPNVPRLISYCIPDDLEENFENLQIVLERGTPVDVVYLVQMDYNHRFQFTGEIIDFVIRNSALDFRDLRRQQFIHISGRPLFVDFDDVVVRNDEDYDNIEAASRIYRAFVKDYILIGASCNRSEQFNRLEESHNNGTLTIPMLQETVRMFKC